jgi:LPS export ABC transporter protein LptC
VTRRAAGVLLLAVGAALGACRDAQEPPIAPGNLIADSADQVIFGARQLLTDRGLLRAELHADTAYFFNEGTRIELRNVNTTFFSTTGAKNATLTSREGTYNTQLGQMSARKNVVVVSEDGRRLTTADLRFAEQANLISSDSAFTVTERTGRRLQGVGFESDPDMNNVRCKAACRGSVGQVAVPASGGSTGSPVPATGSRPNTFVLPGQVAPAPSTPPVASPPPAAPRATPPAPAPPDSTPARSSAGRSDR